MKLLLCVMAFATAIASPAQPFLSIAATSKGAGFSIGYLASQSGIELNAGYNVHPTSEDVPALFNLSVGKRMLLSHQEKDNFSITPSIGYAAYSVKDFTEFYKDEMSGEILQVKAVKPIYSLELGKDWHLGRVFVNANYCDKAFFGIGLRAFIK